MVIEEMDKIKHSHVSDLLAERLLSIIEEKIKLNLYIFMWLYLLLAPPYEDWTAFCKVYSLTCLVSWKLNAKLKGRGNHA